MIASAQILDEGLISGQIRHTLAAVYGRLLALFAVNRRPFQQPVVHNARRSARASNGRLTASLQWSKVSEILSQSGQRAREAAALQAAAMRQIDLAQYGLITLRDELSAVMTLASRRDTAVVQLFGAVQPQSREHALAA